MQTKINQTKGKWEVVLNGKLIDIHRKDVVENREFTIASNVIDLDCAELIVRCVNSHEELVEACKDAVEYVIEMYTEGGDNGEGKLIEQLNKALAKAQR